MTIEQLRKLTPNIDYVVYRDLIYKYTDYNTEHHCLILEREGKSVLAARVSVDLFTLGEYRGSFDSSVHPPKSTNEDRSIIVIIKDEYGYIISGFYNYNTSEWRFFKDRASNHKPHDNLKFTWVFIPNYLK